MVKLYDRGMYLLNGTEIVESCEEVAAKTGRKSFQKKKQPKKQWLTIFYLSIIHPVIWTDLQIKLIN